MSAPPAGKFQDHYLILGLNPKANFEAIQAAYVQAAEKYHPDNEETGDEDKFDAINLAYEVLCDPQLRAEFDKLKGIDQEEGPFQFSGLPFFRSIERAVQLRSALLSVLYDRRRLKPFRPSISMRDVEATINATLEELTFALWYLKQRGLVTSDDKSSLQIGFEGMDYLEQNRPSPDTVLPLIKPAALARPNAENAVSRVADMPAPITIEEAEFAAGLAEGSAVEESRAAPSDARNAPSETGSILALLRRASGERIDAITKNLAGSKSG